jgi:plasmid stabilization system protein ParE
MKIRWTAKGASDLARLYDFLNPAAPQAAARVVRQLAHAPDRLLAYPRLGEKLEAYEPREVRRLRVGDYELRYEIAAGEIIVLRLWHCRENRG